VKIGIGKQHDEELSWDCSDSLYSINFDFWIFDSKNFLTWAGGINAKWSLENEEQTNKQTKKQKKQKKPWLE